MPASTAPRVRRWGVLALAVLLVGGGAAWWFTRGPEQPAPPVPDLSRADSEVVALVNAALDRVREQPGDGAAWGHLGLVLRAHDFDMESVAALQSAEQLDPENYRWPYLQGLTLVLFEPERGLASLRRGAEKAPPTRPEPRLRLAEELLDRGLVEEAERLAGEVLTARPGDARANWVTARAAAARGNWAEVLERAGRCKEDPSCRKRAALLRGEALARLGQSAAADAELRTAAALPPELRWPDPVVDAVDKLRTGTATRIAHAAALFDRGHGNEAVALLRETVARAPTDPEPRLMLGQLLNRLGDAAAARVEMTEHTTRFPDSVDGWFQLGLARFLLGDTPAAIDAFKKTLALKSDHTLAHYHLGLSHRKLGDRTAARAAYEAALRCQPDHAESLRALRELESEK